MSGSYFGHLTSQDSGQFIAHSSDVHLLKSAVQDAQVSCQILYGVTQPCPKSGPRANCGPQPGFIRPIASVLKCIIYGITDWDKKIGTGVLAQTYPPHTITRKPRKHRYIASCALSQ